jgi:hypothetical protein
VNAAACRFRRKVSGEMQARLPAQTTRAKTRDRGGIGRQVFHAVFSFYASDKFIFRSNRYKASLDEAT